jgi:hypothetical protein
MIKEYLNNYLWGTQLTDIDNKNLTQECIFIEKILCARLPVQQYTGDANHYGSITTSLYDLYNIFTFPSASITQLYRDMVTHITPFLDPENTYMLQGWVNIIRKGNSIKPHSHWPVECGVYHGYYCVSTEDEVSFTDYEIRANQIRVGSRDGLLVFGKSGEDVHSTGPWYGEQPRVTIAFDIIPVGSIQVLHNAEDLDFFIKDFKINHYIPFK